MWQINEVVKFDESHYRILFFQSGEIIWIHMEEAKGVPFLVLEEQLSQWIDENAYLEVQTLLNILSL